MSYTIKVNSYTIKLTVHTSCYCVLDLLSVNILAHKTLLRGGGVNGHSQSSKACGTYPLFQSMSWLFLCRVELWPQPRPQRLIWRSLERLTQLSWMRPLPASGRLISSKVFSPLVTRPGCAIEATFWPHSAKNKTGFKNLNKVSQQL